MCWGYLFTTNIFSRDHITQRYCGVLVIETWIAWVDGQSTLVVSGRLCPRAALPLFDRLRGNFAIRTAAEKIPCVRLR